MVGLQHRFGYTMGLSENPTFEDPMSMAGAIVKYDRQSRARSDIAFGQGNLPGEPVFVAAEGQKSEDEGYLMTFVYEAETDTSRFIVMDAQTMDATPVASIELPRIPFGFHGNWIPSSVAD